MSLPGPRAEPPLPFALPAPDGLSGLSQTANGIDRCARMAALDAFLPAFHGRYEKWLSQPEPDYEARCLRFEGPLRRLQESGVATFKSDPQTRAELRALASPSAQSIEQGLAAHPCPRFRDGQKLLEWSEQPALYRQIGAMLERAGVFDVASAYARRLLRLKSIAIQVNTARTTKLRYGGIGRQACRKSGRRTCISTALSGPT